MAIDVKSAMTRKIGPLPAWGWGVAVGGSLLAVKMLRGGGGGGSERETILVPTGAPSIPHEFMSDIGFAIDEIRDELARRPVTDPGQPKPGDPVTPPSSKPNAPPVSATPTGFDLGTYVIGLRAILPGLAKTYTGPRAVTGETRTQRNARLLAEMRHYGHKAAVDLGVYVAGLRKMFPARAASYRGPKQTPGETRAQRDARLRAERAHLEG